MGKGTQRSVVLKIYAQRPTLDSWRAVEASARIFGRGRYWPDGAIPIVDLRPMERAPCVERRGPHVRCTSPKTTISTPSVGTARTAGNASDTSRSFDSDVARFSAGAAVATLARWRQFWIPYQSSTGIQIGRQLPCIANGYSRLWRDDSAARGIRKNGLY